jgi:hypothetical protein
LLSSCSRNDDENKSYPECLSNIISTVQQIPVQKPKVEVKKYKYKNQIVYTVNIIKPDGSSLVVYDESCNLICSSGNTIVGTPFDTCIDWNTATYLETVWTDPR